MFNENLKKLRKSKGFTQEELALKINVVRQTVSKWEKGLSVPDSDVLVKIADVLDINVDELLGADIKPDADKNEIAEQLARLNEQLAIRNRRWKLIWKIVGIILGVTIIASIIINIVCVVLFSFKTETGSTMEPNRIEETIYQRKG